MLPGYFSDAAAALEGVDADAPVAAADEHALLHRVAAAIVEVHDDFLFPGERPVPRKHRNLIKSAEDQPAIADPGRGLPAHGPGEGDRRKRRPRSRIDPDPHSPHEEVEGPLFDTGPVDHPPARQVRRPGQPRDGAQQLLRREGPAHALALLADRGYIVRERLDRLPVQPVLLAGDPEVENRGCRHQRVLPEARQIGLAHRVRLGAREALRQEPVGRTQLAVRRREVDAAVAVERRGEGGERLPVLAAREPLHSLGVKFQRVEQLRLPVRKGAAVERLAEGGGQFLRELLGQRQQPRQVACRRRGQPRKNRSGRGLHEPQAHRQPRSVPPAVHLDRADTEGLRGDEHRRALIAGAFLLRLRTGVAQPRQVRLEPLALDQAHLLQELQLGLQQLDDGRPEPGVPGIGAENDRFGDGQGADRGGGARFPGLRLRRVRRQKRRQAEKRDEEPARSARHGEALYHGAGTAPLRGNFPASGIINGTGDGRPMKDTMDSWHAAVRSWRK